MLGSPAREVTMVARSLRRAGHWGLLIGLALSSLVFGVCQARRPPELSQQVLFVLDPELDPDTCWGVTYYGRPTVVAICGGLPRCDMLHAVKHEVIHVAGLRDHPYDFPPCYNQLRSVEASIHGPCIEEVTWLQQHGLRGMHVRVDDPELAACVVEAARFWNGVTDVPLFISVNGVVLTELAVATSPGT